MAERTKAAREADGAASVIPESWGGGPRPGPDYDEEKSDPLYLIAIEMVKAAKGASAVPLRKVVNDVYPKQLGKQESMAFLASLTRLQQAAEVAYQLGKEIHASVMNTVD